MLTKNMRRAMKASPVTTRGGYLDLIGMILIFVGAAVMDIEHGGQWVAIAGLLVAAVGRAVVAFAARDNSVTSEQAGAPRGAPRIVTMLALLIPLSLAGGCSSIPGAHDDPLSRHAQLMSTYTGVANAINGLRRMDVISANDYVRIARIMEATEDVIDAYGEAAADGDEQRMEDLWFYAKTALSRLKGTYKDLIDPGSDLDEPLNLPDLFRGSDASPPGFPVIRWSPGPVLRAA